MHLVQDARWRALAGTLALTLLGAVTSCSKLDEKFWSTPSAATVPTPSGTPTPTPTPSPGVQSGPRNYEFIIAQSSDVKRKSDILFVLDNSGSMADELSEVYDRVTQFTSSLKGQLDFSIRVTTTDDLKLGELMPTKAGSKVLTSADTAIEQHIREMITAVPFPAYNGVEMGLKGALYGLKQFTPGPVTNVIIFSDEDDESPGSFSQYLTAFQDYARANNTILSFHPVVLGPKSYCPLDLGESFGTRYNDMALAFSTSGSKTHDLCTLQILFSDLATAVTQSSNCYVLPASINSILSVAVDGGKLGAGDYTYNASARALCFAKSQKSGAKVVVSY